MCFLSREARRQAGYTLIEVLLSVAILAVILTMVSLTFSSTFRMVQTVNEEQGQDHQARMSLALIAEDLMMARQHPRFPWSTRNGEHEGQPADLLAFISAGHARPRDNTLEAGLTRVLYTRHGDVLSRLTMRNLHGAFPESIERIDLTTGVAGFDLLYYDETHQEWVDEWDEESRKSLPRAVMIRLTLMNSRHQTRIFVEWAVVPAQFL